MTTFEHGMVGATCAMATNLHERFGWKVIAVSALASIAVDWDGLTILFSKETFAAGHRVWGHNLLAVGLLGLFVGVVDYRLDLVTRLARVFVKLSHFHLPPETLDSRTRFTLRQQSVWIGVSVVCGLIHLPSDLIVSGSASLPDWKLKLLWPFSDRGWICPMVRWGDPGLTLIFVGGVFAMVKWRNHIAAISRMTVISIVAYCVLRSLQI